MSENTHDPGTFLDSQLKLSRIRELTLSSRNISHMLAVAQGGDPDDLAFLDGEAGDALLHLKNSLPTYEIEALHAPERKSMDQLVAVASDYAMDFFRGVPLLVRVPSWTIETQLLNEPLTMVATTAPAIAGSQDMAAALHRDPWLGSILDPHDNRAAIYPPYPPQTGNSSHVTHSPERISATSTEQSFQSPRPSFAGAFHRSTNSASAVHENSLFTDLANDPVAAADLHEPTNSDVQQDYSHDTEDTDDHDRKMAARSADDNQDTQVAHADPFVGSTIMLGDSDDRAFEHENKHHFYDDYAMHGMGDMNLLAHPPAPDTLNSHHGYYSTPFLPEYPSPVRSHGSYPPPPPRSYPIEYRIGGADSYPYSHPVGESRQDGSHNQVPLGSLPAPANTQRGSTKRRLAVSKKKIVTKKPKLTEAAPVPQRYPSQDELAEAKTPRAKAALTVWYERLTDLMTYKQVHGHCNVPQKFDENPALGIWVNKQRMEKKFMEEGQKSSMTWAKLQALDEIGFTWAKRKGQPSWDTRYSQLKEYFLKHGHCRVPTKFAENPALGRWVSTQRSHYKLLMENQPTHMTAERMRLLEEIGFKWNAMERADYDT